MSQLQENQLFANHYKLIRKLGSGSFGDVWLAEYQGVEVAVKIYNQLDPKGVEEFKAEFKTAFELNHTNLLHISNYDVCDNHPFLVMPYCPNGSAENLIQNADEKALWRFIRDVAGGLAYLHEQTPPIVHQDIKPANILIDKQGHFIVTDFGISKRIRSSLNKSVRNISAGTQAYMGPERYSKNPTPIKASDIWSLGATVFELMTGDAPFGNIGGGMQVNGAVVPEIEEDYSDNLKQIVEDCLAKEPWDRPTAEQLSKYADKVLDGETPAAPWRNKTDTQKPSSGRPTERKTQPFTSAPEKPSGTPEPFSPNLPQPPKKKSLLWLWILLGIVLVGGGIGVGIGINMNKPEPPDVSFIADTDTLKDAVPEKVETPSPETDNSTTPIKKQKETEEKAPATISVRSVSIDRTILSLTEGETVTLTATISPSNATNNGISLNSSNKTVVPITDNSMKSVSSDKFLITLTAKSAGSTTIIVSTADGGKTATCDVTVKAKAAPASAAPTTGTLNGHNYVDLGLPSGLKWATCNIGASTPSDYGNYYAWGEISTKAEYYDENCKTWEKSIGNIAGNAQYDAARANWGGKWRLPTKSEFNELINKCNWQWTTQGGHKGYKVTGPNENSIFLPAAGFRYGTSLNNTGEDGLYWSATPNESNTQNAHFLYFYSSSHFTNWFYRYVGQSVRPVAE